VEEEGKDIYIKKEKRGAKRQFLVRGKEKSGSEQPGEVN